MQSHRPSPAMRRMQWIALVMLVISGTVNYLDRSALAIGNPEIRQELGLSATEMGVLLSAFLVSYAFAQLPAGLLVDRVGPRTLLGTGLAVWSLAQTVAGFVTSFTQFWWARVFLGIGEAPQFPTGARVVSDWFNVKDRGFPTGVFNSASSVGPALAPPILTALMLAYGWRVMFIAMGVAGLMVAAIWFLVYRDPSRYATAADEDFIRDGAPAETPVTLRSWARLFRFRTTWGMVVGNFCFGYLTWIYFAWLPGFLEIQHHLSVARTGIFAAIPPFLGIFGSLFGGYVSDRLARAGVTPLNSRRIPIIGGIIGTAGCTILAAFATGLHAGDDLHLRGGVLQHHHLRNHLGARDGGRTAAIRRVHRQHPELRRLSRRHVFAGRHRNHRRHHRVVRARVADRRRYVVAGRCRVPARGDAPDQE